MLVHRKRSQSLCSVHSVNCKKGSVVTIRTIQGSTFSLRATAFSVHPDVS